MSQRTCVLPFLALVHFPCLSSAQAVAQSFGELSGRLKAGDTVYVIQASDEQTKGKFIEALPTSLALSIDGRRHDFSVTAVRRVERERSAMKRGALFGLLAGGAVAVLCGISERHCGLGNEAESGAGIAAAALAATALAVGGGVAVGAVIGGRIKHRETVSLPPPTIHRQRRSDSFLWSTAREGVPSSRSRSRTIVGEQP